MTAATVESVTDNAFPSARVRVSRNAYLSLAGHALEYREGWVHCSACGGKSYWRHCVTCHQQPEYEVSEHSGSTYSKSADHGSCFSCGRCLPPRDHRRRYCSTTCRVRAHNYYHETVEGRVKLAELERKGAAWNEALLQAFGRASDEEIRRRRASWNAETCGDCGDELGDGEPVFRRRKSGTNSRYPVCRTCCPDPDSVESWGTRKWIGPTPCEACARPVYNGWNEPQRHVRFGPSRYRRWAFCSERCYRVVMHRRQKDAVEAKRQTVHCTVCGERVDARRRDARYCSPACRQAAYRARAA